MRVEDGERVELGGGNLHSDLGAITPVYLIPGIEDGDTLTEPLPLLVGRPDSLGLGIDDHGGTAIDEQRRDDAASSLAGPVSPEGDGVAGSGNIPPYA